VLFSKQVLKIPNYDPQCGIKLFEANFTELLFRQAFISKWLFDLELFIRAKRVLGIENYLLQTKEIVLNEWSEKPGSKLNKFAFFLAPIELIKIYFTYKN